MTEKENNNSNPGIGISEAQLEQLLTRVIKAVKEPTAAEQKKIDAEQKIIQQDQENRKKTAQGVKDERENKKRTQQLCSHEHPRGDSHCVWVQEKIGPGYLLCQKNQCIIRPGVASPNYKGSVIFSNELFNKIFQKLNAGGADIIG